MANHNLKILKEMFLELFEGLINNLDAAILDFYPPILSLFKAIKFTYSCTPRDQTFWDNDAFDIHIYPNQHIVNIGGNVYRFKMRKGKLKLYKGLTADWFPTDREWYQNIVKMLNDYYFEKTCLTL